MKRKGRTFIAITAAALCLAGCGKESAQSAGGGLQAAAGETVQAMEIKETKEADAETEAQAQMETPAWDASVPYVVENPQDGYYAGNTQEGKNTGKAKDAPEAVPAPAFSLKMISEQVNGITDEEEWFSENGLVKPGFPYADETYEYQAYAENGETAYDPIFLELYDMKRDELALKLDFTKYQYGNDFAEENRDFIGQRILWAKEEDGILYTAIAHNTYAEFSPHTAYMTAIGLKERSVIWKSMPLTCNSYSFEIIGDSIVCGYGFTAEADYLNIIEKRTGRLQEQIPLKSQPVYILRSGRILYVRTYDTDYRFEIAGAAEVGVPAGGVEEPGQPMEYYDGGYEKEVRLAGTKIRYRMMVADAVLGSRFYVLLKSSDDGINWEKVSPDPFDSNTGMGIDFTFLTEDFGFAALSHNGGDSADLWVTYDGGKSYQPVSMEEYTVTLDDGFTYVPYDFPQMPYEENGLIYVLCGQGADGDYNGGDDNMLLRYRSSDGGRTFSVDKLIRTQTKG